MLWKAVQYTFLFSWQALLIEPHVCFISSVNGLGYWISSISSSLLPCPTCTSETAAHSPHGSLFLCGPLNCVRSTLGLQCYKLQHTHIGPQYTRLTFAQNTNMGHFVIIKRTNQCFPPGLCISLEICDILHFMLDIVWSSLSESRGYTGVHK